MNKNIGELVKQARNKNRITQQKLAENTGISRSYLSDIEANRYNPSTEKLIILAKELDIDLNLLKNDGNTSAKKKGGD